MLIDWDIKDKWDIKFDGGYGTAGFRCPAPFNQWIPATDCNIRQYVTEDFTVSAGSRSNFSIPSTRGLGDISCTFLDFKSTIKNYIESWFDIIYPNGTATACILDPGVLRLLTVAELDISRNIIGTTTYIVRLFQDFTMSRSSDDNFQEYAVSFKIHGINSKS